MLLFLKVGFKRRGGSNVIVIVNIIVRIGIRVGIGIDSNGVTTRATAADKTDGMLRMRPDGCRERVD